MKFRRLSTLVLLSSALAFAAATTAQEATEEAPVSETPVQVIELVGSAATRDAEISSLAWYGDYLVLLTENPFLFADGESSGAFFALEKGDILDYLDAEAPAPLEPFPVPIYSPDIYDAVSGFEVAFDGFEAITFVDAPNAFAADQVFLTIEADTVSEDDPTMRGYVVWGTVLGDLEGIELHLDDYVAVPPQTEFNNMSYESLLNLGDSLVALYEVNGETVNADAAGYRIDLATGAVSEVSIDNLSFRLTDVTSVDADNRFWAVNYFFPGEDFLADANDPLFATYGMGASQAAFGGYERLVEYEVTDAGLELVETAPIQLLQTEDSSGRNWEGIARLDDLGLLIVTDRYPQTILGLVALPAE